ncbi:protein SMALL AUXIN UP-REGULATED RNA 16-like [Phragmites australis]|uniref:protein SMALL AUXIN UP-REGULATED RNA 16-like n=1 Tax=Phragmites australis TaxID=29695 RepID=UPI002D78B325|nr:protein SMALL AUXIN UP-REGULATED RNA 16-like [Phragmites australis]
MAIKKGGAAAAGLKQILRRCSSLGRRQQQHGYEEHDEEEESLPSDVPRGHFAVYVGERRRRFVVPIALLDRPEFRSLLLRAEEEFGFAGAGAGGILVLPCEEVAFRSLTSALACGGAR